MDQDRVARILAGADQLHEESSGMKRQREEEPPAEIEPEGVAGTSTSATTSTSKQQQPSNGNKAKDGVDRRKPAGRTALIVNGKRQKRNKIVGLLRIPIEYEQIEPDFITGPTTCVLFLQLKYHKLHPEYIGRRLEKLGKDFELRVLMLKVEEDDRGLDEAIKDLTRLSVYTNLTLIVVWSDEEAARWLKNLKMLDTSPPTAIMGQSKTSYEDQLNDVVTSVRGVNKNNATTLVSTYGSLRDAIIQCDKDENKKLEDIIGWGPVRAKAFKESINMPFVNK